MCTGSGLLRSTLVSTTGGSGSTPVVAAVDLVVAAVSGGNRPTGSGGSRSTNRSTGSGGDSFTRTSSGGNRPNGCEFECVPGGSACAWRNENMPDEMRADVQMTIKSMQ